MFCAELTLVHPPAKSSEELLTLMGTLAQRLGYAKASFTPALLRREQGYPTGLETDCLAFAVPHTDTCHVLRQAVAVAKLEKPLPFVAMGLGAEIIQAELVFMLLLQGDGAQVVLLQKLMNLCADKEVTCRLRQAQDSRSVLEIIREYYSREGRR